MTGWHGPKRPSNLLTVARPDLIQEIDLERNPCLDLSKLSLGSHRKVTWTTKCGHSFEDRVYSRIRSRVGCPYCSGQRVLRGFNDLEFLRPDLIPEWSDKNDFEPFEVVTSSHKVAKWVCSESHEWETPIYSRAVKGNNCSICSNKKVILGVNDPYTRFGDFLNDNWGDKNDLTLQDALLSKQEQLYFWQCNDCQTEWKATLAVRIAGFRKCPKCFSGSRLENTVADFLKNSNIRFIQNSKPLVTVGGPRRNLEIDFLLIDYPFGFEVQDFSTHQRSELPLENVPEYFGGGPKKGPTYHDAKRAMAKDQLSIELIDLWEDQITDGSFKTIITKLLEGENR